MYLLLFPGFLCISWSEGYLILKKSVAEIKQRMCNLLQRGNPKPNKKRKQGVTRTYNNLSTHILLALSGFSKPLPLLKHRTDNPSSFIAVVFGRKIFLAEMPGAVSHQQPQGEVLTTLLCLFSTEPQALGWNGVPWIKITPWALCPAQGWALLWIQRQPRWRFGRAAQLGQFLKLSFCTALRFAHPPSLPSACGSNFSFQGTANLKTNSLCLQHMGEVSRFSWFSLALGDKH